MSAAAPSEEEASRRWRGIGAAIAAVSVVGVGLSLQLPLLAFRLEEAGFSRTFIGLNTTAAGLAALGTAPFVAPLVRLLGLTPLMVAAAVIAAVAFGAFAFVEPGPLWFALRFVEGVALTVLFVTSEYWISAVAEERRRGFVMGLYGTLFSLGLALGPALLSLTGTEGHLPFLAGAALMLSGVVPILLGGAFVPAPQERSAHGFWALAVAVPAAALAAFVYGAGEAAILSFLPLFGLRLGLDAQDAALLLTLVALGNVLLQIPVGILSDRVDRGLVLGGCALVGIAGAALLPYAGLSLWHAAAILLPWGGAVAGLYTVGLAHLGSRIAPEALAGANAAFIMLYSIGLLLGPIAAGLAMDASPLAGLPLALGGLCALYLMGVALAASIRHARGFS